MEKSSEEEMEKSSEKEVKKIASKKKKLSRKGSACFSSYRPQTHAHTRTHARTRTHTHTHTHTHARTHAHTCPPPLPRPLKKGRKVQLQCLSQSECLTQSYLSNIQDPSTCPFETEKKTITVILAILFYLLMILQLCSCSNVG